MDQHSNAITHIACYGFTQTAVHEYGTEYTLAPKVRGATVQITAIHVPERGSECWHLYHEVHYESKASDDSTIPGSTLGSLLNCVRWCVSKEYKLYTDDELLRMLPIIQNAIRLAS